MKCPKCGKPMRTNFVRETFVCDFCGREFTQLYLEEIDNTRKLTEFVFR